MVSVTIDECGDCPAYRIKIAHDTIYGEDQASPDAGQVRHGPRRLPRFPLLGCFMSPDLILVAAASFLAGLIDAIVGGGGLVLLPALSPAFPTRCRPRCWANETVPGSLTA